MPLATETKIFIEKKKKFNIFDMLPPLDISLDYQANPACRDGLGS